MTRILAITDNRLRRAGLVTDASDRDNNRRIFWIVLDFGTKALYVDIHQSGICRMAISPYILQEHLARENLPGPPRQTNEEIKLKGC